MHMYTSWGVSWEWVRTIDPHSGGGINRELDIDLDMSTPVTEWDDKFLGEVYEKLTGKNVEIEEDPAVEMVDVPITSVEERGSNVLVEYISMGLTEVQPASVDVSKEVLVEEVERRDTIKPE